MQQHTRCSILQCSQGLGQHLTKKMCGKTYKKVHIHGHSCPYLRAEQHEEHFEIRFGLKPMCRTLSNYLVAIWSPFPGQYEEYWCLLSAISGLWLKASWCAVKQQRWTLQKIRPLSLEGELWTEAAGVLSPFSYWLPVLVLCTGMMFHFSPPLIQSCLCNTL